VHDVAVVGRVMVVVERGGGGLSVVMMWRMAVVAAYMEDIL